MTPKKFTLLRNPSGNIISVKRKSYGFPKSATPTLAEPKEFNKRYQETSEEVSQIADATSDNANIMFNKLKMLQGDKKWIFNAFIVV